MQFTLTKLSQALPSTFATICNATSDALDTALIFGIGLFIGADLASTAKAYWATANCDRIARADIGDLFRGAVKDKDGRLLAIDLGIFAQCLSRNPDVRPLLVERPSGADRNK